MNLPKSGKPLAQPTSIADALMWRVLDKAHRKRNLAEYEGVVDIDEALVDALLRVAGEVGRRVVALADRT